RVVVGAIGAALAVGFVVLAVIGDQVGEGEAVVAGDEVDGGDRPAPACLVEVARARQPGRELRHGGRLPAPEVPYRVAVLAVPFAPQGREVAHLVAALADVPGPGDDLDLRNHRGLLNKVEEGPQAAAAAPSPGPGLRHVHPE